VLKTAEKIQFDLLTVGSEAATPDKLMLANGKSRFHYYFRNRN
jgi:cob(I)alamin adenosyltransferase